jgi:hypothetical protein
MPSKRRRGLSPRHTLSSKLHRSLSVFELLLGTDTELEVISDNSTYSFVFYGVKRTPGCFTLNGMSFNQFCMKISLVCPVTSVTSAYKYLSVMTKEEVIKKYSTRDLIDKEVRIQKRLDEIRVKGGRPIVPYVIHDDYLSSSEFENLGCWNQPRQDKVTRVVGSINYQLTQSTQQPHDRPVHIFFMEYIDTSSYKTLAVRIPEWDGMGISRIFLGDRKKKAYQRMAANLAIMPGCNVIPYDAQENNVLVDTNAYDLRSIDFGNTYDLKTDETKLIEIFKLMLRRIHHSQLLSKQPILTLEQLCVFFGVTHDVSDITKTAKDLVNQFDDELEFADVLVQKNNTPENIHHNLIMTAFIDFMMYGFGIEEFMIERCTCRFAMESVYGQRSFEKFSNFLTNFRPSSINETHRRELAIIQGIIQDIVTPSSNTAKHSCVMQGGSNPTFIQRYLPDTLSIRDKIRRRKELMKSRRLKQRKYYTRKVTRSFKSKTTVRVHHIKPKRRACPPGACVWGKTKRCSKKRS